MVVFTEAIVNYIVKYYNVNRAEVIMMVEDEWDAIEDAFYAQNTNVKEMAKELLNLYMVA
ncbi:MAG TPA: hypothetical protein CFH84_10935 [Sulfurimonas sp. UBA12504]|nr:MAG: hypothetical protein A2019_06235 [Sulfurimonas sp. GWF2_37_8]DAB29158.1 MAG TPA: hypothetical protein CFH84_10935 [Sulfurimonas sp. UBA12504]